MGRRELQLSVPQVMNVHSRHARYYLAALTSAKVQRWHQERLLGRRNYRDVQVLIYSHRRVISSSGIPETFVVQLSPALLCRD